MFGTNFASEHRRYGYTGGALLHRLSLGEGDTYGLLCACASDSTTTSQGLQYFRLLGPLFDHLHAVGTARDRAGNRQLFYDQYATLLLLYFFNPTVTSLRGLQQTDHLARTCKPNSASDGPRWAR